MSRVVEDKAPVIDLSELAGETAAVLLVNCDTTEVVYANEVARSLSPGLALPIGIDKWSEAVTMRDDVGHPLSTTGHGLSRLIGNPTSGGQTISVSRVKGKDNDRQFMWAVVIPVTDAPGLQGHCMVALLPLSERERSEGAAAAAQAHVNLRDRAVLATDISFTMADARVDDMPLVWVNPAFTATTGYGFDEVVNKNCRFLQGADTDPAAREAIRRSIDEVRSVTVTILNYRKDGEPFWNQLAMNPMFDASGSLTHFVGIQTDVTETMEANLERDRALASEQIARQEAESAWAQVALLADATEVLSSTLDVERGLDALAERVIPQLADWAAVVVVDKDGRVETAAGHHRNGSHDGVAAFVNELRKGITEGSAISTVLNGAPAHMAPAWQAAPNSAASSSAIASLIATAENDSVMVVPLTGRGHVNGAMLLARHEDGRPYGNQDLAVATDLGRRAGLIFENVKLYQSEHHVAETLQRSFLPRLPSIENVTAAARYRPGEEGVFIGGDFYDLIALPNGSVGFLIGDVVGHDILAAASMGQLHGLLRACAWEGPDGKMSSNPADVLHRVDELIEGLGIATMATVTYGALTKTDSGDWNIQFSDAGHPPLMVRRPDGEVMVLNEAKGVLLGVQASPRTSVRRSLPSGSIVVAYTDGLIERHDQAIDESLRILERAITDGPGEPEALCDHLLESFAASSDDVALMAVQLL